MKALVFLIFFSSLLFGCASSGKNKRDTSSTYERRAAMEELRRNENKNQGQLVGPVIALPILWYMW